MLDKTQKKSASSWLRTYAKQAKVWINITLSVSLMSGLLLILQASLLATIINKAYIKDFTLEELIYPLVALLIIMLIRAGLGWLREWVSFQASSKVRQSIRMEVLKHIAKLGPVLSNDISAGNLSSRAIEQVEALHGFFADFLPQMTLAVALPFAILAFVFPLTWLGGLILLISAPLIPLFMALIGMGVESVNQRHFAALAKLSGQFLDSLQGLTTLKLFRQSRAQLKVIEKSSDEYRQRTMSILRIAFLSSGILELFSSVAIAILAIYLGLTLIKEVNIGTYHAQITLTKALFILLLAPEFYLPLRQLAQFYHARAQAIASAFDLMEILSLKPIEHEHSKNIHSKAITIKLHDVDFSYNDKKILNKINIHIEPGEHIAIVGESGAGKSTLLNLLTNFITPSKGTILINNTNLNELDLTDWRQHISCLTQSPKLLLTSIRENIRIAKPTATDAEVEAAARKAHVKDFIDHLEKGFDTIIGENNLGVSGGQAKRIALARVILANKPILLLDEPTASIDSQIELALLKEIRDFAMDKTVIVVSHREQTIAWAHKKYRIANGECYAF